VGILGFGKNFKKYCVNLLAYKIKYYKLFQQECTLPHLYFNNRHVRIQRRLFQKFVKVIKSRMTGKIYHNLKCIFFINI